MEIITCTCAILFVINMIIGVVSGNIVSFLGWFCALMWVINYHLK
jgi:hypothetical protein